MNEVELVFYGHQGELESSVLQKMGVVHYRPASGGLKGLFAVEKRYGSEVQKPLTPDILGDHSDADWIIYRYLSADEEKAVRENKLNKRIYVILHNYYSFNRLYESLLKENINQYSLVVDRFNTEIKNIHDVNSVIKTKNYFNIIKPKIVLEKKADKTSFDFSIWIMLVALGKILLNPINELNRYSILVKYSQARVLIRFVELFSFFVFLVRWVGIKLFYETYRGLGISRVVSIKAGFLTRHLALISAFKLYGVVVDAVLYLCRIFKLYIWTPLYFGLGGWLVKKLGVPIFNFIKFNVRHVVIMVTVKVYGVLFDVGVFLYRIFKLYLWTPLYFGLGGWLVKKLGVPIFNFIKFNVRHLVIMVTAKILAVPGWLNRILIVPGVNFFKFNVRHVFVMASAKAYGFVYDVVMWSDRWVRLPVANFFKFTVRHFFLMVAYKTYGFAVDLILLLHRIGKLYLMFPFYKIYWFATFQYKKRIKKYFV